MIPKTANQLYKESGSTLPFKDWIEREKSKGVHIPNEDVNKDIESMLNADGKTTDKRILLRNIAFTVGGLVLLYFAYSLVTQKKE